MGMHLVFDRDIRSIKIAIRSSRCPTSYPPSANLSADNAEENVLVAALRAKTPAFALA